MPQREMIWTEIQRKKRKNSVLTMFIARKPDAYGRSQYVLDILVSAVHIPGLSDFYMDRYLQILVSCFSQSVGCFQISTKKSKKIFSWNPPEQNLFNCKCNGDTKPNRKTRFSRKQFFGDTGFCQNTAEVVTGC